MFEITGHYVQVNGLRTYYEEAGSGRPVVCLAMAGASGSQYHCLLERCAGPDRRMIAPDLPGRGKTLPPLKDLRPIEDTREYLDFIWAFIEVLGLEKPVLMGQAMTANAVLLLAKEHPDEVEAVVACNGGVLPKAASDPLYNDLLNHPGVNLSDYKEAHIPGLCGPDIPQERINECLWYGAKTQIGDTAVADSKVFAGLCVAGRLAGLTMPILLLNGGSDITISKAGRDEILSLPGAVGRIIPGAGHYMAMEKPEELADAVGEFLDSIGR